MTDGADALRHRSSTCAHNQPEGGKTVADLFEIPPRPAAEDREINNQDVEPQPDEGFDRLGAAENGVRGCA